MNILIIISLLIILFLLIYSEKRYNQGFDKGFNNGVEWTEPQIESLKREAVIRGFAKWVVVNDSNGKTIFQWHDK